MVATALSSNVMTKWLPLDEAARRLRLDVEDVSALVRRGSLQGCRADGVRYVQEHDVVMMLFGQGHAAPHARSTFGLVIVDLADYVIEPGVASLVGADFCRKHKLVPLSRTGESLIVAVADPLTAPLDELAELTGLSVEPVVADANAILTAVARFL